MRIFLVAIFVCIGSFVKANQPEPLHTLPFEIHLGHIYIQAKINDSRSLNLVFDTGAAANLASEAVAEELGLDISGSQQVSGASGPVSIKSSRHNKLWLSENLGLKNQTFLVMNLDHLGDYDFPLDGIIGANVLDRFVVELNFDENVIRLYDKNDFPAPAGYTAQKIKLVPFRIPIIEGGLMVSENETITGPYLVDTGAALALRINTPTVDSNELRDKVTPNFLYTGTALGNTSTDHIGRLKGYSILNQKFDDVPIRMANVTTGVSSFTQVDGILGLEILKRFNMIFDYRKKVMYIQKNNLFDVPFRNNTTGLKIKKKEGYLEVENVIPKSAAEKADLKVGDQILSVNGNKKMTHDAFHKYAQGSKKAINLSVKRGDKTLQIKLTPFSMI